MQVRTKSGRCQITSSEGERVGLAHRHIIWTEKNPENELPLTCGI